MFLFISGVQSFVRTNDCKSYFYFYFWSAIVRMYERLQVKFFISLLECNHSYVRMIASHFKKKIWSAIVCTYEQLQANFFKNFWSAIVRTYEQLQAMSYFIFGVRSES